MAEALFAGTAPERAYTISLQTVTMAIVVIVVAAFVLYPIYFLLQAALDVGEPNVRPPTAYGLSNFAALAQ